MKPKRRPYTKAQSDFIMANYRGKQAGELRQMFNERFNETRTLHSIKSFLTNRGLSSGAPKGVKRGISKLFTLEQLELIKANAKGVGNEDLTRRLNERFGTNFKVQQIRGYKNNNGISSGLTGQFEKGREPHNKGKTWDEFMSKAGQANSRKTQFKKGHAPHNCDPVGTEKLSSDGYVYVKIKNPDVWKQKHHVIWEQAHGKIPEGKRLGFLNQNPEDIRLENLVLMSGGEAAVTARLGLFSEDAEFTKAGLLISKLIIKSNEMEREK